MFILIYVLCCCIRGEKGCIYVYKYGIFNYILFLLNFKMYMIFLRFFILWIGYDDSFWLLCLFIFFDKRKYLWYYGIIEIEIFFGGLFIF